MAKKKKQTARCDKCHMPTKAHSADAGFDIYSPVSFAVDGRESTIIDTGVHFEIPDGYVGFLKSKSGLNVKSGINTEGVIDSGYTGSVVVKMYNHSDSRKCFDKGDKITQIVFLPVPDVCLENTESFAETERGNKGFGSTGR